MLFLQEAKTYIDKLIRLRRRLINDGRSRSKDAATSVVFIENYLANYPCNNNRHMAAFFNTNYHHIINLIPGGKSPSANKFIEEARELRNASLQIINPNTIMIYQISQGVPQSPFFALAQPHSGNNGRVSLDPDKEKTIVECKNPRTGETSQAEIHDLFTFNLIDIPDGISLLAYGIPAGKLISHLLNKYPELKTNPQVEFLLLKRK